MNYSDVRDSTPSGPEKSPWNSLEIAKLIVGIATTAAIVFLGIETSENAEESAQYAKVVEKRSELWDAMGPKFNDIYAFSCYVGNWRNIKAEQIRQEKRELDKTFYSFRPYFSQKYINAYGDFINAAFEPSQTAHAEARIRVSADLRKVEQPEIFAASDNRLEIRDTYFALLAVMTEELNLPAVEGAPSPERTDAPNERTQFPTNSWCSKPPATETSPSPGDARPSPQPVADDGNEV